MPLAAERVPWGIRGSLKGFGLYEKEQSKIKGEPRMNANKVKGLSSYEVCFGFLCFSSVLSVFSVVRIF